MSREPPADLQGLPDPSLGSAGARRGTHDCLAAMPHVFHLVHKHRKPVYQAGMIASKRLGQSLRACLAYSLASHPF
jgi:hypothetical protein